MSFEPNSLEGVPSEGRIRLDEMKQRNLFTSDLSVDEYLLVKAAGYEPVGFVVGSSIYHIGYQQSNWKVSQEMQVLSGAMYRARELAMTRMEEEAFQLGAHGVVGVRLEIGRYEWGENMAEFIAVGTAVRKKSGQEENASPTGKPFTSDLSGQDFYKLISSGHHPLGLVMGSCVYHVAHRGMFQSMKQYGQNVELEIFTQALYEARETAMERMTREAEQLSAAGVVAVKLSQMSHGWGSHVLEFFAIGTAIADSGQEQNPQVTLNLGLDG
jgi:uncharacterized protein YbjQ (UPF0145 family)